MLGTFINVVLLIHKHKYYCQRKQPIKTDWYTVYLFKDFTGFNL